MIDSLDYYISTFDAGHPVRQQYKLLKHGDWVQVAELMLEFDKHNRICTPREYDVIKRFLERYE